MNCNQNDYTGFTEGQFAADESFQSWVLEEEPSAVQFWESYLLLHPGQREAILRACGLLKALAGNHYHPLSLSSEEKTAIKQNIYQNLNLSPAASPSFFFYDRKKKWRWWSAVAALLIASLSISFLAGHRSAGGKDNSGALLLQTGPDEMKRIVLEDQTEVILNANSSLRCRNDFPDGPSREVFLEGNAFFRVQKDLRHTPFVVHARSLVITVLGTELNVNARSAAAEVELTKGKVKVEAPGEKRAVTYLQPGEKLKRDLTTQAFVKSKMDAELYSAWTEGTWNFRQTSLEEITGLLQEYYGVNIVFENESSRHLRINAVIPVTSLRKLIPVIEQTLQIKIALQNNQLILQ